jgi:cob(I)alamin adenosyltransferase
MDNVRTQHEGIINHKCGMKKTIQKIYTRTGDKKVTHILGGFRISKRSARIESIGSLDELNSFLGFLLTLMDPKLKRSKIPAEEIIKKIQNDLFVIGAELSYPIIKKRSIPHPLHFHYPESSHPEPKEIPKISHTQVHDLEEWMDQLQVGLPPLDHFVLSQGNSVAAFLQIIRAICRRTERRIVQLATYSKVNPLIIAYLNRLSDLLFVLSRAVNRACKGTETIWDYSRTSHAKTR